MDKRKTLNLSFKNLGDVEDSAAAILYSCDKFILKSPQAVDAEKLAKHIGTKFYCDYFDEQAIAFFASCPQRIYAGTNKYDLLTGEGIIERSFIEKGDITCYNYAAFLIIAASLLTPEVQQLQQSFDLSGLISNDNICFSIVEIESALLNEQMNFMYKAAYLAECLALPKNNFKLSANRLMEELSVNRGTIGEGEVLFMVNKLSEIYKVTKPMAFMRLKHLQFI